MLVCDLLMNNNLVCMYSTSVRVKGLFEGRATRDPRKDPFLRARRARKNGQFRLFQIEVIQAQQSTVE